METLVLTKTPAFWNQTVTESWKHLCKTTVCLVHLPASHFLSAWILVDVDSAFYFQRFIFFFPSLSSALNNSKASTFYLRLSLQHQSLKVWQNNVGTRLWSVHFCCAICRSWRFDLSLSGWMSLGADASFKEEDVADCPQLSFCSLLVIISSDQMDNVTNKSQKDFFFFFFS